MLTAGDPAADNPKPLQPPAKAGGCFYITGITALGRRMIENRT